MSFCFRDHPRGCGEQLIYEETPAPATGSPPRMRGTDQAAIETACENRITPADAGNSMPQ